MRDDALSGQKNAGVRDTRNLETLGGLGMEAFPGRFFRNVEEAMTSPVGLAGGLEAVLVKR